MSSLSIYLNFQNQTEEAFAFYKSVFGTEFSNGLLRFGDLPPSENQPPVPDEVKSLVMHVALPILGGIELMGSDAPEQFGFKIIKGNNVLISLNPDTKAETDRLFSALSEGGSVRMALQDTFWGAYHGSCTDKFGIQWMFNCRG